MGACGATTDSGDFRIDESGIFRVFPPDVQPAGPGEVAVCAQHRCIGAPKGTPRRSRSAWKRSACSQAITYGNAA